MKGELKPNSHQNIKMTCLASKYPTHFEGEIQTLIEWDNSGDDGTNNGGKNNHDQKSAHTNTVMNDCTELLYLRLKKRSKIVRRIRNNLT